MSSQTVTLFLSILTLFSNILFFLFILLFLFRNLGIFKRIWKKLLSFITVNNLYLCFFVSLLATAGSLYFSEVAGFEPCKLCWFQRIFMYPLPVILAVSIFKNLKDEVKNFVLPLSGIGGIIAVYHYYFQITGDPLIPCSAVGFSVSCSERFFTYFGYITISWMSFSAFLLIFSLIYLERFLGNFIKTK